MMRFVQSLRLEPNQQGLSYDLEAERRGDYDPPLSREEELLVYGTTDTCKKEER